MSIQARIVFGLTVAVLLSTLVSCGSEGPPLSREEIMRQRAELPAVYLTMETNERVIAPTGKGVFVDEKSGQVCWLALACYNPDCPARKPDGEPFLYIAPDWGFVANPDGTVGYDRSNIKGRNGKPEDCPECRKVRNLAAETDEQRQQYINWARPYVLPETAERMKELDDEMKRRIAWDRRRRVPPPTETTDQQPTPADPSTRPNS